MIFHFSIKLFTCSLRSLLTPPIVCESFNSAIKSPFVSPPKAAND